MIRFKLKVVRKSMVWSEKRNHAIHRRILTWADIVALFATSQFLHKKKNNYREKQLNLRKGGRSFLMTALLLENQAGERLTEPGSSWPHCVQGARPIYIICFLNTHHYSKS